MGFWSILGLICTVGGGILSVIGGIASDKKQEQTIANEVTKQLNEMK